METKSIEDISKELDTEIKLRKYYEDRADLFEKKYNALKSMIKGMIEIVE